MMRPLTLQAKILLLAFLNIVLLLTVGLIFARVQFRLDLGSFLLAPARERILATSRLVALELPGTSRDQWNQLLARYISKNTASLYLFDDDGEQLAGETVTLPDEIKRMTRQRLRPPPPHNRDEGPHFRPPPEFDGEPRREPAPLEFTRTANPTRYWAATHMPVPMNPGAPPLRTTMVWRFDSLWTNPFFFNFKPWLAIAALTVLISAVCWLPFIRGLTRAISNLKTATGQIAEGNFEVKLSTARRDEIGQLSDSINQMAQRLSSYVSGQKRFLGDIAHELCSPIARLQLGVGILDQHASPGEQPYVARVQEEIQHMSALVNELLSFSKASLGARAGLESVNVLETVRRSIERESRGGLTIETKIDGRLSVVAQPDYLFRSISNVLRNAIRYAGHAGPIVISALAHGENVSILIADEGPGVPAEELEEIVKPFYRPESARQAETGGVGLGLAIVRTCMEACGGQVSCRNRSPRGFEVELLLAAA
jgi:two-component system sensor histidine kinase CpxA